MADEAVLRLVCALGTSSLSVAEAMQKLELKHRPTFLQRYLHPALDAGLVRRFYPDAPRHPRQRYQLTAAGLLLWGKAKKGEEISAEG